MSCALQINTLASLLPHHSCLTKVLVRHLSTWPVFHWLCLLYVYFYGENNSGHPSFFFSVYYKNIYFLLQSFKFTKWLINFFFFCSFYMQNPILWGFIVIFPSIIKMCYTLGQIALRFGEANQIILSCFSNHTVVENSMFKNIIHAGPLKKMIKLCFCWDVFLSHCSAQNLGIEQVLLKWTILLYPLSPIFYINITVLISKMLTTSWHSMKMLCSNS